jgi:hypothetical protein
MFPGPRETQHRLPTYGVQPDTSILNLRLHASSGRRISYMTDYRPSAGMSQDFSAIALVDVRDLDRMTGLLQVLVTGWVRGQATVEAALGLRRGPRIGQLQYSLDDETDGPSAGALMSVGSPAARVAEQISSSIVMTDTGLPDPSVGAAGTTIALPRSTGAHPT